MELENSPEQASSWIPEWFVDVGHGCTLGVTIDDHCFVVLYPDESGQWSPGTRIPEPVARFISSIVVPDWASRYMGDSND